MAGLTIDNPVTLTQAFSSHRIIPGDVLRLATGTYAGSYTIPWSGTEAAPIQIRPAPGAAITIDGSLEISGKYIEIYDIDFIDTAVDRTVDTPGITCNQVGFKLVGCDVRGMRSSCINWFGGGVGEVLECVLGASEGHAIYSHNSGGIRQIARTLFEATPHYGLHVYSAGSNTLGDYQIVDNVHLAATNVGGGLGLKNLIYDDNVHFGSWLYLGRYKIEGGVDENCEASGNILIDPVGLIISDPEAFACSDNLVYSGDVPIDLPAGFTDTIKPATLSYTIPFTLSARWAGIQVDYDTASGSCAAQVVPL